MLSEIKRFFYFPIAHYFRFFAKLQLQKWQPKVVVITGSSGKTTALHLLESQIGDQAKYSHHANSSFGISFDILGIKRQNLKLLEWPKIFLTAPLQAFKKPFPQKLYIVEADCDRPNEGKFLASLLNPEYTLWLDVSRTHTINFDNLSKNQNKKVEEVIASEFGYFAKSTKKMVLVNGDDKLILNELGRINSQIKSFSKKYLEDYLLEKDKTTFKINGSKYTFNALLPEETYYPIAMCLELMSILGLKIDPEFKNFILPPGRSSLFKGIKNSLILDSSYNTNFSSMTAILSMYKLYPAPIKWAVLSDMTELGDEEDIEHEKLAQEIISTNLDQIILMGPRMIKYTYPKLKEKLINNTPILTFQTPKEVLDYLLQNIKGGEMILFKGARFLEGVIEHLLENKEDIKKLCRREKVWQERREKWGL